MKKLKLKMWVKVVLIITILIIGIVVYNHAKIIGEMATANKLYLAIVVVEWAWLMFGQLFVLSNILER